GPMARLYREAPVNSIWEGSGNVMCLDVLRAIGRDPEGAMLLLEDLGDAAAGHAGLLALLKGLQRDLRAAPEEQEALARRLVQRLALAAQSALMLRHAPQDVAEAFVASRLDGEAGRVYGTMAEPALQQRILDRAWPTA
ncbi:MAG: isovaleryl-CoA dehydrogenase, partial [Burkholderia sp.]|nr:isovaleryl-CoA dehydrogenase [Burkholderia sp.]